MNHEDDIEMIKKTLDDTLYVFSAEDGGVAFARLIHSLMPAVYSRIRGRDERLVEVMTMFEKWSALMKLAKGDYDDISPG